MKRKANLRMVLEFIRTEVENMRAVNRFGVAKNYACAIASSAICGRRV